MRNQKTNATNGLPQPPIGAEFRLAGFRDEPPGLNNLGRFCPAGRYLIIEVDAKYGQYPGREDVPGLDEWLDQVDTAYAAVSEGFHIESRQAEAIAA